MKKRSSALATIRRGFWKDFFRTHRPLLETPGEHTLEVAAFREANRLEMMPEARAHTGRAQA
ncbi:MAG: hypothetical protein ACR2G6_09630 [Gemmatimonadaceae bacterium]